MLTKANNFGAQTISNNALEDAIDRTSLGELLGAIGAICEEKADHILASYGDEGLARQWSKVANQIGKLADECKL